MLLGLLSDEKRSAKVFLRKALAILVDFVVLDLLAGLVLEVRVQEPAHEHDDGDGGHHN